MRSSRAFRSCWRQVLSIPALSRPSRRWRTTQSWLRSWSACMDVRAPSSDPVIDARLDAVDAVVDGRLGAGRARSRQAAGPENGSDDRLHVHSPPPRAAPNRSLARASRAFGYFGFLNARSPAWMRRRKPAATPGAPGDLTEGRIGVFYSVFKLFYSRSRMPRTAMRTTRGALRESSGARRTTRPGPLRASRSCRRTWNTSTP